MNSEEQKNWDEFFEENFDGKKSVFGDAEIEKFSHRFTD